MKILEELAIRLAWINFILSPKARFECSPDCNEDHTYLWPCRQRIRRPKYSTVGAYHDANTPHLDLEGDTDAIDWMTAKPGVTLRDPICVDRWPECIEGGYNPACCRFPKACSCENYVNVEDA